MRYSLIRRMGLWCPPILYMAMVFRLSSESRPIPAVALHVWDKLLHLSEYAVLGLLFARAFVGEGVGWLAAMVAAMLVTSAYGWTDEWHQSFVPLRSSDIHDWFADVIGAVIGISIYRASAAVGWIGTPRPRR